MQPPKSSICVICGVRPATTKDHLPPRGFFKGISAQFLTVPACTVCNNGSSEDDEILRNFISAQIGLKTIGAKFLWEAGAHKSLLRSPQIRSIFLNSLFEVSALDDSGVISSRLGLIVPIELYQRVFARITRGLHFLHTGRVLAPETPVHISLLHGTLDISAPEILLFESHSIADGAFNYKFLFNIQDDESVVWLFNLHGVQWVLATTAKLVDVAKQGI